MLVLIDFDALAHSCAPNVAPATLRAMATVESSHNPHAIGVVNGRLARQPRNLPEAISTVMALQQQGTRFSAGLIQIYVKNWPAYQLDHESVFDPCANMRAAAGILTVSVWPSHLDAGARTRRYLRGFSAPTKATHSTRLSAPIIRYFSASVRTAIRSWSPSQP